MMELNNVFKIEESGSFHGDNSFSQEINRVYDSQLEIIDVLSRRLKEMRRH